MHLTMLLCGMQCMHVTCMYMYVHTCYVYVDACYMYTYVDDVCACNMAVGNSVAIHSIIVYFADTLKARSTYSHC